MSGFFRKPSKYLAIKIALIVIGLSFASAAVFIYLAYRSGVGMLVKTAQARAGAVSDVSVAFLEHLMLEGNHEQAAQSLKAAVRRPQIKNIYIVRPSGVVVYHAGDDSLRRRFELAGFHNEETLPGIGHYTSQSETQSDYILFPIRTRSECYRCHPHARDTLGYFIVGSSQREFLAITGSHRKTNIAMTIILFSGLAGTMLVLLAWMVVRPIGRLHSHMETLEGQIERWEEGKPMKFSLLPEPRGNDEIAHLARAFNSLVHRLNRSNEQLIEVHQQEIDQAGRIATMGEMAASLAHEIKNPIAGVYGALQIFDSEMSPEDPHKEILHEMMTQLGRINQIVNDLLMYARPSPPYFERVNVHTVLERIRLLLIQQVRNGSCVIDFDLAPGDVFITADEKMLHQLLWNLMLNGLQAIESRNEEAGKLSVTTRVTDGTVAIAVSDTGRGIPPDVIDRIFKPFFTTKHKGTGLGLAISKRIVDIHGGTIVVRSEPDSGTAMTVSFSLEGRES